MRCSVSRCFVICATFTRRGAGTRTRGSRSIRAILERHTLQIDAYQLHTGDRAFWQGHYYSDKAPGASLLALVPVALARGVSARWPASIRKAFPASPGRRTSPASSRRGVFTVIAALCVFWWLALRWGCSRGAALFAATAYGVASPAWAYATLFMGHGLTAGCLMLALSRRRSRSKTTRRHRQRRLGVGGRPRRRLGRRHRISGAVPAVLIVGSARCWTLRDRWPERAACRVRARVVAGGVARRSRAAASTTRWRSARRFISGTQAKKASSRCIRASSASPIRQLSTLRRGAASAAIAGCCRSRRWWRSRRSAS